MIRDNLVKHRLFYRRDRGYHPSMGKVTVSDIERSVVAHDEIRHLESVSVGLWFRSGTRYESPVLHGGAHFLEHMLFKGTRHRKAFQISEIVESKGGDLNAFTSEEMTCYYCRIAADHLPMVLDVLFDMLWHSTFPVAEMERERGVILEEIRMYEDQPHVLVMDRLNTRMWPDSSLGRSILGTPESVASMKRQDLMQYWRSHYRPRSLVVSVAGCVAHDELLALLKPHLGYRRHAGLPGSWSPAKFKRSRRVCTLAIPRPVQQCSLALGIHGMPRKDPRRFAEKLLSVILGENMSSRLFQVVRERHGLAYYISTSVSHFHDTGAFYIQAGVDREKLEEALGLIAIELEKIARKPPTAAELRRAKDYTIGQMKLGMESTSNRMMWMGECIIGLGSILHPTHVIDTIQSVGAEDVRAVAADLFQPGKITVAAVGPDLQPGDLADAAEVLNSL